MLIQIDQLLKGGLVVVANAQHDPHIGIPESHLRAGLADRCHECLTYMPAPKRRSLVQWPTYSTPHRDTSSARHFPRNTPAHWRGRLAASHGRQSVGEPKAHPYPSPLSTG